MSRIIVGASPRPLKPAGRDTGTFMRFTSAVCCNTAVTAGQQNQRWSNGAFRDSMLLKTGARALSLIRQTVLPSPFPGPVPYLKRLGLLLALWPPVIALQVAHWLGFLLDEIAFRGYRKVAVRTPLFVLGVPRSGTTFMHRLLARDPALTTLATWECIFAPSVSERYFWLGVAALDRRLGGPLARTLRWCESRALGRLDDVHPTALAAPEEDYWTLMPLLSCFVLVVAFPRADWLWRMARFDRDMPARERDRLVRWYRRCLQRHLYVHGAGKTLLSKNAAFAGMATTLVEAFPDCRLVICERDALSVIESQFRSLDAAMCAFETERHEPAFRDRLIDCLDFYYANLDRAAAAAGTGRCARTPIHALSRDPQRAVQEIYSMLERPVPADVTLAAREHAAGGAPSPREPRPLARWGLDPAEIGRRFAAWRQPEGTRL